MNDGSDFVELPIKLRVPRSAFVIVAPQPATVTQKTVEQHFGLSPRVYRSMVRDRLLPAKRIGRLIFAAYDDVKRVLTEGAVARPTVAKAAESSTEEAEVVPMSVDAASRYIQAAQTSRERREREQEIEAQASDLMQAHAAKLDDGSPNPKHDKARHEHGMDLFLATFGLRRKASGTAEISAPGLGYYAKCCWCERPAYATKQTWDAAGWYWGGGPVCDRCAKRRAPNERVVQFEGRKVLLPARDPTVPTGWDAPRRPRRPR